MAQEKRWPISNQRFINAAHKYACTLTIYGVLLTFHSPSVSAEELCTSTGVILDNQPALKTECSPIYSSSEMLDYSLNSYSTQYSKSINPFVKALSFLGLSIGEKLSGGSELLLGFPDQKIPEEGSFMGSTYNSLMNQQYRISPLRTEDLASPFN